MKHVSVRLEQSEKDIITRAANKRPRQSVNNFMIDASVAAAKLKLGITKKDNN